MQIDEKNHNTFYVYNIGWKKNCNKSNLCKNVKRQSWSVVYKLIRTSVKPESTILLE